MTSFLCWIQSQSPGGVLWEQSREGESPPSTFWPNYFSCRSGYRWLSEIQVHIASSCPFFYHKKLQVFLCRAALNLLITQPVLLLHFALILVQHLALSHVKLHEYCTGPLFKPVQVPLDTIPSLQPISHTTQLGVISKLAKGALITLYHHCKY